MQWYLHSYFARQNRTSAAFNYQSSAILFNGLLSSCNVNKLSFSSFKLATNESKLFFVFNAGKPLKTQGTKFFGICRILWCKKDVPKKTLDAFIHFHTLSYALEGFTCAKKQNVASSSSSSSSSYSSSATYTNVRLSRCAAGKKLRNLIFWERPFANLEVDLQPLTFRAQAGMVKQFKACSVVARCSPYSWIPEWGGI